MESSTKTSALLVAVGSARRAAVAASREERFRPVLIQPAKPWSASVF
ncbi:hypothetical protein BSU04_38665 [Caballeronia sordidicola]|uniref:Uncharacterized protein n=1 Tax=Caballeronia sordidicola TaxID=196367 RepID=A0A226WQ11_CABSO|nr:hypothetical protein BSU04_38665 [Caballeronia sordidicola]